MKNNSTLKQAPVSPQASIPNNKQVPQAAAGVVVGAVVNKPQHSNALQQGAASLVNKGQQNHVTPVTATTLLQAGVNPNPGILHTVPVANGNHTRMGPTSVSQAAVVTPQMLAESCSSNGDCASIMANTKEKTPMCLVNELARFNKIQHQYRLTDEQGPAHKKIFYVKLKLGEEEYAASGPSIKKAQHAAAAVALDKTQYKHPPPKPPRNAQNSYTYEENGNITPTVELNALAMKRGEPAIYHQIEPQRQFYPPPNFDFRGMYNQRYHYPRFPRLFYVSLKVGPREFIGEGSTRQMARHNAAGKALKVVKYLPLPHQPAEKASIEVIQEEVVAVEPQQESCAQDELKSEISLVHEIALKRHLQVNFEVIRESGPPHMRSFITRCSVGEVTTEGEGNGKKVSKKRAAEMMLEELKKLPDMPSATAKPKKPPVVKKKNRNLIKMQKAVPDYGVGINPISRLIQIQQAKKEKEPVYTLVAERGLPRRREFVMQVVVGSHQCTGVGPNKKLAKRAAAEVMLQKLGYSAPSPQPAKPAIKSPDATQSSGDKKVTFLDQDGAAGRQLVPGVLLMPDSSRTQAGNSYGMNRIGGNFYSQSQYSQQTTAAIAKELLDKGSSPTAESINKAGTKPATTTATTTDPVTVRPRQQLLYLADVLGITVQFTDFPKGSNKNDYLSLVSLSTNPPQVSHGAGSTIEMSHDSAALTALKALAELGLDSVSHNKNNHASSSSKMAGGDGPHVKFEEKLVNSKAVKTEG